MTTLEQRIEKAARELFDDYRRDVVEGVKVGWNRDLAEDSELWPTWEKAPESHRVSWTRKAALMFHSAFPELFATPPTRLCTLSAVCTKTRTAAQKPAT